MQRKLVSVPTLLDIFKKAFTLKALLLRSVGFETLLITHRIIIQFFDIILDRHPQGFEVSTKPLR